MEWIGKIFPEKSGFLFMSIIKPDCNLFFMGALIQTPKEIFLINPLGTEYVNELKLEIGKLT
tara:strand:+ start:7 stop:192 length:186 start_codon:yes stop_codon:yes gene_type:complete